MVAERLQVAKPLWMGTGGAFQRAANTVVQLSTAGEEKILVDNLMEEGVREPVARAALPRTLDEIGGDERFEIALSASGICRDGKQKRLVKQPFRAPPPPEAGAGNRQLADRPATEAIPEAWEER